MKNIILSIVIIASAMNLFAQPLTGTKTIGPAGDYTTFNAASADLLANGVGAGGVEFLVSPGIYNETVQLFEVNGANAVNRIKFTSAGDSVFVVGTGTSATSNHVIRIDGGDFYTFDGINVKNGGTSAADFCEIGYLFVNLGSFNNGCQGNIIKNCSIDMHSGSIVPSNSSGVRLASIGTVTSVVGAFNNNKLQNLKIDGANRGCNLFGNVGFEGVNNEISNCIIGGGFGIKSQTTANSAIGTIVSNLKNTKIFGNEIVSVNCASNVTAGAFGMISQLGNSEIYSNKIKQVFHSNPNINGVAEGMEVDAVSAGESFVYNNLITGIDNAMTFSNSTIGISGMHSRKFTSGVVQPIHWYNNTVVLSSSSNKSVFSFGFTLNSENGGHTVHLKNNIIVNTMNGISNFSQHCLVDFNNTAPSGKLISNNNCLVASGTLGRIGRNITSPQLVSTTLANWQANNPGLDVNSVSVTPTFVSATDFHLVGGSNPGIENGGTPLAQVVGDIDFQVRQTDSTDIGADEVLSATLQQSAVSITSDMSPPIDCGTSVTFTATPTNAGPTPIFNWRINGILAATNVNPFITNQLNPGDIVHCEMTSSLLSNSSLPISSNSITVVVNPASLLTFFLDFDEDGFGRNDFSQSVCVAPLGYVSPGNDCNDFNISINPGIAEICDGLDNNCLNGIDDGLVFVDYFVDNDNDTFGGNVVQSLCAPPPPSITCDGLYTVTVQGTGFLDEVSWNIKNAANVVVATGGPFGTGSTNVSNVNLTSGPFTFNIETQGSFNDNQVNFSVVANGNILASGFVPGGQNQNFPNLCGNFQIGPNFVTVDGDCDDNNAAINPSATEVCDNGVDDDCDGVNNSCLTTQIQASQCGTVLPNYTTAVVANFMTGAAIYRFKIVGGGIDIELDRPVRWFKFSQINTNWNHNATYQISVATQVGGVFGSFGAPCSVTLPPPTAQIINPTCGSTLLQVDDNIIAQFIPNVSQYKFIVSNNGDTIILIRPVRFFKFTNIPNWSYGSTYLISVSLEANGVFGPAGQTCAIITPAPGQILTSLESQYCNGSVGNSQENITAIPIPGGAEEYHFLVENQNLGFSETLIRNVRFFRLNMLSAFEPNTEYSVMVKTKVGGVISALGNQCFITTPGGGIINPHSNTSNEDLLDNDNFKLDFSPNPFADAFTLNIRSESNDAVVVRVYDMNGKMLENRNLQASEAATVVIGGNLAAGMYHVTVMQGDNLKTMKMIKTIR